MLQWARAKGCPWDERAYLEVAHNGHLEVLQWAKKNGVPFDEMACRQALSEVQPNRDSIHGMMKERVGL